MNYCIINGNFPVIKKYLEKSGYICIDVIPSKQVSSPLSSHSDVLYRKTSDASFVISSCQGKNAGIIESLGYRVFLYDNLSPGYITECGLNFILNDKYHIYNPATSLDYNELKIKYENIKHITVKQGYTSCSIAQVTQDAYITRDQGVYNALKRENVDCIKIKPELVKLEGYNEGFIGGACVKISEDVMLFFGTIEDPDEKIKIENFLSAHNVKVQYIEEMPLTDIGSAVILR